MDDVIIIHMISVAASMNVCYNFSAENCLKTLNLSKVGNSS